MVFSQTIDTTSFSINSRLSFYSFEKQGEMILHIPSSLSGRQLSVILKINETEIGNWKNLRGNKIIRLPFSFDLYPAKYPVTAEITSGSGSKYRTETTLIILRHKTNEVKTDCLTGSLIVCKRIFFPFGFYCYSPVYPTLPEEEAVKGFNMISPYQKIQPGTTDIRKSYMDRCAQLGMKVHYNLLSVSGGGGVSSRIENITEEKKTEMLISEVKAFMDHPALLAWYISDEPNGNKIPPEQIETIYNIIKAIDPWHPVTVVFMAPFIISKKYENGLDIVMADPYPVPKSSISQIGDITKQLKSEFYGEKPVWIVPQAFGGGEWWEREPSINEIRSMTYQAIVNGATGIQYFIRQGLNSFPKSTATWNECGKMALEIAEITPWLLSDEDPPSVRSNSAEIQAASAMHDGQAVIVAVNRINSPFRLTISANGVKGTSAKVLFEDRSVPVNSGTFSDYIPAFGSQVYLIDNRNRKEAITPFKGNLIRDPGFEDITSPGVPSACYAWNEGDRGATYFLDSREHLEGDHSLRLVTPQENNSARLRFFPVNVTSGRSYIVSIWAKTDIENKNPQNGKADNPYFELSLGGFGNTVYRPGNDWQQFVTNVTIPTDTIPSVRANVVLRMPGKGTAWFDMLQVFEAEDISRSINPEFRNLFNQ
ncbi:MAG: hypothetical protein Q8868_08310 [Bacteroidota bacterium]|nr:hypothetical protein [Bacteroidota bacterium]